MDEKMKEQLAHRIDEVLHYIWDPIGVSDTPEARDEYASYANSVWRAVLNGKSKNDIADMLTLIATESMGLDPRKDHDEAVAEIVLDWAQYLKEHH